MLDFDGFCLKKTSELLTKSQGCWVRHIQLEWTMFFCESWSSFTRTFRAWRPLSIAGKIDECLNWYWVAIVGYNIPILKNDTIPISNIPYVPLSTFVNFAQLRLQDFSQSSVATGKQDFEGPFYNNASETMGYFIWLSLISSRIQPVIKYQVFSQDFVSQVDPSNKLYLVNQQVFTRTWVQI